MGPGPEASEGAPIGTYREPEDGVLLFGEMYSDAHTIQEVLRNLPFNRGGYRGSLRVILAAARRIEAHAEKLLGEEGSAAVPKRAKGTSA